MRIATDVDEIMNSYFRERGHQEDLHNQWISCNWAAAFSFGLTEITRAKCNDEWWGKCERHINRRRNLLTGRNGFRNALEVALQLRSMGKGSAEIRRMMLDVHVALSAVLDITDAQLDELLNYDRTFGEGD